MPQAALKKIIEEQSAVPRKEIGFAAKVRGFGPIGVLGALLVVAGSVVAPLAPVRGFLTVLWAWASRTPWSEIGYVRPKSWLRTIAGGLVLGALFKLGMKAVVMPALGAPPVNRTYHFLVHNAAAMPAMIFTMIVTAGFGEESFYRGFCFERLGKLFGTSRAAKVAIVFITSGIFAAVHYPEQGVAGSEQAFLTGLAFGTAFVISGRLVGVMAAHAAFDLTALAMIYWDIESKVAHFFFR